jgi:hypothetical protein
VQLPGLQRGLKHVPPVQTSHGAQAGVQVSGWQTPPTQTSAPQQSHSSVQPPPEAWQQVRVSPQELVPQMANSPQQWQSSPQTPPVGRQQVRGAPPQKSSAQRVGTVWQHWLAAVQVSPTSRQTAAHVPPSQKPPSQSLSAPQPEPGGHGRQLPPPQSTSVSVPFLAPSVHDGTVQKPVPTSQVPPRSRQLSQIRPPRPHASSNGGLTQTSPSQQPGQMPGTQEQKPSAGGPPPLTQVCRLAAQSVQAAPLAPQASFSVPGRHSPAAEQQPVVHLGTWPQVPAPLPGSTVQRATVQGSPSSGHWASTVQQPGRGSPRQTPLWQVSGPVQGSPSSQGWPSCAGSASQLPVAGSQRSQEPHRPSLAQQSRRGGSTQAFVRSQQPAGQV